MRMRARTKALIAALWTVGTLCALPYVHRLGVDEGVPAALSLAMAAAIWPVMAAYWCIDQVAHVLIALTT